MPEALAWRPAAPNDQALLERWMAAPHVRANVPDEDWGWAEELPRRPAWRQQLIAMLGTRPVGFVQIIDAAEEESHYWGDVAAGHAAIDLWIGEPDCIGRGLGTTMMREALRRSFTAFGAHTILIDPLVSNTAARRFYERLGFRCLEDRWIQGHHCAIYTLSMDQWVQTNRANALPT